MGIEPTTSPAFAVTPRARCATTGLDWYLNDYIYYFNGELSILTLGSLCLQLHVYGTQRKTDLYLLLCSICNLDLTYFKTMFME